MVSIYICSYEVDQKKGHDCQTHDRSWVDKEVGLTFYKDIVEIVQTLNIPPELIINIDQTPIPYILVSKYSMNQKNPENVPI